MFDDDFDRTFRNAKRMVAVGWIAGLTVNLAVLVFAGWVAIKLLAHFGVI